MSIDKNRLERLLLDEAHEWLEHFDKIQLRLSSQLLLPQIQSALRRGDHAQVRSYIERLIELSDKIQKNSSENFEPSIIRIKCALAAYQMENYNEAIALLEKAIPVDQGLKGRHLEGTIKCMLGCIQWQLPNQGDSAIISWEETMRIYQELEKLNSGSHVITRSTWYSIRLAEISAVVEEALELADPPQPSSPPTSETSTPNMRVDLPEGIPVGMSDGDLFRLFRVRNEVSAGNLRVPGSAPFGYVEINQFQIDGLGYYLVNLRKNGKVVTTVSGSAYEVVRVSGESMTAERIDDGDYVLLRLQETAEHNDIVAAQVHSIDTEATLKKFLIEEKKLILRFRSNNHKYKHTDGRDMEFQFYAYDPEKFQIVGVAIAVFKPLDVTR
jgi:tetratricopeptide (TPR) repeat protein